MAQDIICIGNSRGGETAMTHNEETSNECMRRIIAGRVNIRQSEATTRRKR